MKTLLLRLSHEILLLFQRLIVWSKVGGGGFFFASGDFGRMSDNSFPACAFFFFLVKISSRTLISLFRPGLVHSGLAS